MKKSQNKKIVKNVLVCIFVMLYMFASLAETIDELKAIFLTREELNIWASSEQELLDNLEINGQQRVQKEVRYQMWIRNIHDEALETISSSEMQSMEERKRNENAEQHKIIPTETSGDDDSYTNINWLAVTTNSSNWMSNLPNSRYLNEINLPGTHDSGTKVVKNGSIMIDMFAQAARCQDKTIYEQLNAGIRVFDLRVDESLNICHGSGTYKFIAYETSGEAVLTLDSILTTIRDFLSINSDEVVVVCLKVEDGNTDAVVSAVNTLLNNYTLNIYTGTSYPKLSDVRGKIVLLSRISSLGKGIYYNVSDNTSATKTIDGVTVFMEDHYDADSHDKVSYIDSAFNEVENYDISVDGSRGTHSAFIFTSSNTFSASNLLNYESPQAVSQIVNPHIINHSFIQGKTYGYIMMDYVTEDLSKKIYQSNP